MLSLLVDGGDVFQGLQRFYMLTECLAHALQLLRGNILVHGHATALSEVFPAVIHLDALVSKDGFSSFAY